MRRLPKTAALAATAAAVLATFVAAQGMDPLQTAVKARQSQMFLFQFNLMTLGGMAQGNIPYDAAAASAAANNLLALSSVDQSGYWLPGTAMGEVEGTRAKPELFQNMDDMVAKVGALHEAATAMAGAAGTDLAALQGAMQALGGACGACHQAYRAQD